MTLIRDKKAQKQLKQTVLSLSLMPAAYPDRLTQTVSGRIPGFGNTDFQEYKKIIHAFQGLQGFLFYSSVKLPGREGPCTLMSSTIVTIKS